jgi:hypothetical protein
MVRIIPYTEWEHQNAKEEYLAVVILTPAADAGGCGGTGKIGAGSHGRCSHSQHLNWGRGSVTKQVSRGAIGGRLNGIVVVIGMQTA